MACGTGAPAPTPPAPKEAANCRTVSVPVSLPTGIGGQLSGDYCVPVDGPTPTTLQLAVHGGTYAHDYWAWPQQPATYNYIDKAVRAGYAVLAVDRLGNGASSHPPSTDDTAQAQVSALQQVIIAARSGVLGPHYGHVEYIGHSFGSYYGVALVSQNPTLVNALLLTGFGTRVSAATTAFDTTDDVPANYLPRFAGLDSGYVTNKPGTRAHHLYYLPDADPAVINLDEQTEDTLTRTELSTRPKSVAPFTQALPPSLPILIIDGNHDLHYCTADTYNCTSTNTWLGQEAGTFPPSACLAGGLEESGHDLQLHRSAPTTDELMLSWSQAVLPPTGPAPPGCPRRGALTP